MNRKLTKILMSGVLLISLLAIPTFASAAQESGTLEDLNVKFVPHDLNESYIVGTKAPNVELVYLNRKSNKQSSFKLSKMSKYTKVKDMKLVDQSIVFSTYEFAGYSEQNYRIMKYDIAKGTLSELLFNKGQITLQGASNTGLVYTVDSAIKGNELWYYDNKSKKKTKLESSVGSAHMSGDVIAYTVPSASLMELNEAVYYVSAKNLKNKVQVPFDGENVKTNGKYIAFWCNNTNLSTDRSVYIYNIATKETFDYSIVEEGDSVNQDIVFMGNSVIAWNTDNSQTKVKATTVYDLKTDDVLETDESFMPIAASKTEILFYDPVAKGYLIYKN
ncbi:hypothetical protein SAMN05880501_101211 [Ureibacillus xyleni]|uniref:TolB protein n=1 Tax=Ureibacillus xyleni TaxID=614648 RepID=A0A285REI6_9BACL|nr:hypothetical protein [Ureibacillus xyleni]SOB90787.1 hypothetical protein SAMN05880501_101211 [Ureibacillus xyleni]